MNEPAMRTLPAVVAFVVSLPRRVLLALLWVYQHGVSPWRPPTCRFYPSCSQYAVLAVTRHGAVRGSWLAVRRLARCHPWTAGGVDDVPDRPGAVPAPLPVAAAPVGTSSAPSSSSSAVRSGAPDLPLPSSVPATPYEIRSSAR